MQGYPITTIAGIGDAAGGEALTAADVKNKAVSLAQAVAAQKIGLAIGLAGGLAIGWYFFRKRAR